jgi:hypothetical protein
VVAGVQVAASAGEVDVWDGITTGAGNVGGGNGFKDEFGLVKIFRTKIPTTNNARSTMMVNISQTEIFMAFSILSKVNPHLIKWFFSQYIRDLVSVKNCRL